jgi:hypothetical protein
VTLKNTDNDRDLNPGIYETVASRTSVAPDSERYKASAVAITRNASTAKRAAEKTATEEEESSGRDRYLEH